MTRKDYVAIAHAFNKAQLSRTGNVKSFNRHEDEQWCTCRLFVADVLAADNPRFDRNKFYKACEGKGATE